MGLVLKHVERTRAGSFQYRRRVPKNVSTIIVKREFKQKLGDSEKEALKAWPLYHAQVEREIEAAQRRLALSSGAALDGASEREAYAEALRRRADLIAAGTTQHGLELVADSLAETYPQDEYVPQGVSPVDAHTINLLRLGPERYKAPAPTLDDAKKLYLKEKLNVDDETTDNRVINRVHNVLGMVKEALGKDPVVASITREDARKVRDHMLYRLKSTGERISPASVAREMNTIKAVVTFAKTEFGLPDTFQNPFNKLSISGTGGEQTEADARHPLPPKVLKGVRSRVVGSAGTDLALIWRLLEATGCRMAEITGLRTEDMVLTGETGKDFPHIRVTWHEDRRVKTKASVRHVPLVGDALDAAKEALDLPREGHMLFPRYGRVRGSDAASAALMKHVRAVSKDPKHVVHSLRHNMKDNLILAEVASLDQNLILGHALGGVGDRSMGAVWRS